MADKENVKYQAKMSALGQRYTLDGQKWSGGDAAATREWVAFEKGRLNYWKEIGDNLAMFFINRLEGAVLARWRRQELPAEDAGTEAWDQAIIAFLDKQKTMADCSSSSSNRAAVKPITEKWRPGESLDRFYERLSEIAEKWQFLDSSNRDKLLLNMLISSMPSSTEQMMLQQKFTNSSEALVFLHQFPPTLPEVDTHVLSATAKPYEPVSTGAVASDPEVARLTRQVEQLTARLDEAGKSKDQQFLNAVQELEKRTQPKFSCGWCGKPNHNAADCHERLREERRKLESHHCLWCNETGHVAADCRKRLPQQQAPPAPAPPAEKQRQSRNNGGTGKYCAYCGMTNHTVDTCHRKQMVTDIVQALKVTGGAAQQGTQQRRTNKGECYKCHEIGHFARECPNRNRDNGGRYQNNGQYNGQYHHNGQYNGQYNHNGQYQNNGRHDGRYQRLNY